MMKKIIAILLLISVAFSLTSCGKEKKTCKKLNSLTAIEYSCITVDITTESGGESLNSHYEVTGSYVKYEIERFNTLPTDGNWENVSPNAKDKISGRAEVVNGEIVSLDGASADYPSYEALSGRFNFNKKFFKNMDMSEDGVFRADVENPKKFIESNLVEEIDGMSVVVEYNDDALESITLVYQTPEASVKAVYVFVK